jgi:hypothetical protein
MCIYVPTIEFEEPKSGRTGRPEAKAESFLIAVATRPSVK